MKTFKVLNIKSVFGMVIAFLSQQAYAQHKVEKPMTDQQKSKDTVEMTADGLKVTQTGSANHVEINQSAGRTSVAGNTRTTIIDQNGNRIVYHSDNADSTSHVKVRQSGSGNNVVIRQSGGGNSVKVSQSPEKKKEE
ncbi:hypothetical protein DSL64_22735 [Dyadobacter luteus]|uniref:Curlin n=1 Tax=Dyadobacter luteus TaxID=2259619 RepID=A0A3D8Y5R9_9BACT|nr:curlin repeat-containing protein [Dyadobacter luteus]REA57753.1 hypothetical protein DSL64_22735 [Dyadobacter luteus]